MIDYIQLGGTLFIPATHKDLKKVVEGDKYRNLKSVVVDCEDSITVNQLEDALFAIKKLLINLDKKMCLVFIRPRDAKVLKKILEFESINKIDGFILPKFSLMNAKEYLKLMSDRYSFMPSIEGEELFNQQKLLELKEILVPYKEQIIIIRFGLEDMLRELGMMRGCDESVFDFSSTSFVLGNFIATFKSAGFGVSGGVYHYFKDNDGYKKDILRDMKEGLFTKTIIHPNQIAMIDELYKVSEDELKRAKEILKSDEAVFNQDGKMAEVVTMSPYAKNILKRAEIYGVN